MIALSWLSLICAAIPAVLFVRNLRVFQPPCGRDDAARVSVLIPARDEEANIAAAVTAALVNPKAEVVVLDDNSTDQTFAIVTSIAQREPRLRVLRGEPLPAGWIGKNFACAQLAAAASQPLLLFVDADVRLAPDAAARLASSLEEIDAQMISGVPHQEMGTFSEKLLVPLIQFLLLGFLPLERMRGSRHPAYGSACGQLIMVDRRAYEQSGGHSAIRGRVHDGLALPKQFRAAGFRTDLVDVGDLATCRMYRHNGDVWRGLVKNTHEGLGAPALIVPMTLLLGFGQVLPFAMLARGSWIWTAAALLALLPRFIAWGRFRQPLLGALLHPLGVAALLAIQWVGLIRWLTGKSARWKGRQYTPARSGN
ncbi:MAG: glycosyltransferase family 2 protein [Verrucomicrobiota bacterium]|nr:glycosyltransferase family 2 protein [Verrucomicrobiota bacterium]